MPIRQKVCAAFWCGPISQRVSAKFRPPLPATKVKLPHVFQIPRGEALAKFQRQPFGQCLENFSPVSRPFFPLLLMFDDATADFEVRHHLEGVDDGDGATPGELNEAADLGDEGGEAIMPGIRAGGPGRGDGFSVHRLSASWSRALPLVK